MADFFRTIRPGGSRREYLAHVPDYPEGSPAWDMTAWDVWILLHGGFGNAVQFQRDTQRAFETLALNAPETPSVVIYGQGTGILGSDLAGIRFWNADGAPGLFAADDVAYLAALLSDVNAGVARVARVFLAGMSQGSQMANRAALELNARTAGRWTPDGCGSVEGCVPRLEGWPPGPPVRQVQVHARGDDVAPWDGGFGSGWWQRTPHVPVDSHVHLWCVRNGCAGQPSAEDARLGWTRRAWEPLAAEGGARVVQAEILRGGHYWPEIPVDASEFLWDELRAA